MSSDETVSMIMIRHAQSEWNAKSQFTGWADPPLTESGMDEARKAGKAIAALGIKFDRVYTSVLQRASTTAMVILDELDQMGVPAVQDWRLNERHYGALTGVDKDAKAKEVGKEQVHRWRRGYADKAPAMDKNHPYHPRFDARYQSLKPEQVPDVESLHDTRVRVMECWEDSILPRLKAGETILLSAHGNTLRGLIMALDGMTEEEVEQFEIPTGTPIEYKFDKSGKPLSWRYLKDS